MQFIAWSLIAWPRAQSTIKDGLMLRKILISCVLVMPLPAAAQAVPAATTAAGAPAGQKEKLICRSDSETGSIIAKKKRCYTRAEWDQHAQGARDVTDRLLDDNRTRPSGQ